MDNMEESKLNCEKIWNYGKKKRFGKYGGKVSWKVKIYRKYGRKASWILKWSGKCGRKVGWVVKWYGKYGRKASRIVISMENVEEMQVE